MARKRSKKGGQGSGGRRKAIAPPAGLRDAVRSGLLAVAVCLFLSGAASLALEVVWTRLLRLVFGSTTLAVSTILVAYMLGLGLGGLVGGRWAGRLRNGVRAYGWMEVAIGVYALGVPTVLSLVPELNRGLLATFGFWPAAFVRFAVVLVVLLLPTVCMGATLPALVAALVRHRGEIANRVGLLYGINTLGAVTGVFLATFVLFPWIGVWWTNVTGAVLDLLVGGLAIVVVAPRVAAAATPWTEPGADVAAVEAPRPRRTRAEQVALWSYAIVGFTALTYEVCWTRALAMIVGSSVYAFATMLMAFLIGIALGSLLARRWLDRVAAAIPVYGVGLALLGTMALAAFLSFRALPDAFPFLLISIGYSPARVMLAGILVAAAAMLGPTLVLGALFPLLTRAVAGEGQASRSVGNVYFANTVGSASGAFAAGFLLIPWLGLRHTMALAMALNFAAAAMVLLVQRQWGGRLRGLVSASAVAAAIWILALPPQWDVAALSRGVYRQPNDEVDVGVEPLPLKGVPGSEILYYREGINTTVSAHRELGELHLRVNGKVDGSSGRDMGTQVLSGHIPMVFGPKPEKIMVIGLATGVTVGSAALHDPQRIDVVELEPAMIEVSRYFDGVNHRPLDRPNVRLIVDDGRSVLSYTDEKYDLIISEPSNPWITGASNLFTVEFFRIVRRALAPGGRLLQWVQMYGLQPDTLATIIAALRSEFPYIYGFANRARDPDLLMLASETPLRREDLPRWEDLGTEVRADLERIDTLSEADLWSLLRYVPADFEALARRAAAINSDDNMIVELHAPRSLYDTGSIAANWERLSQFLDGVVALAEKGGEPLAAAQLGKLALAYEHREDSQMAQRLVELGRSRGGAPEVDVADAVVRMREGELKPDEVAVRLDGVIRRHPQNAAALYRRALLRLDHEIAGDALADSEAALRSDPDNPRLRYAHLRALMVAGREREADAEAQKLLRTPFANTDPTILSDAGSLAAALGRYEEGIDLMRRFIEKRAEFPRHWVILSQMYEALGRSEEAKIANENATIADRNLVLRLHQRALRAERAGMLAGAIADLELALLIDENYEAGRRDLERLLGGT